MTTRNMLLLNGWIIMGLCWMHILPDTGFLIAACFFIVALVLGIRDLRKWGNNA